MYSDPLAIHPPRPLKYPEIDCFHRTHSSQQLEQQQQVGSYCRSAPAAVSRPTDQTGQLLKIEELSSTGGKERTKAAGGGGGGVAINREIKCGSLVYTFDRRSHIILAR